MVTGFPLLYEAQVDLRGRRLLSFLHERTNHDYSAADRRDIDGAGYAVTAGRPQFPQLPLQVLHVRLAQTFQSSLSDTFGQAKEPCLHVRRKRSNLSGDDLV
jgi:hypothetical protein